MQFRPGAFLPLPLVQLAVEVRTGRSWLPEDMEYSLEKIVGANLLDVWEKPPLWPVGHYDVAEFKGASGSTREGYRMLDLVAMWLTERNGDRISREGNLGGELYWFPEGSGLSWDKPEAVLEQESNELVQHKRRCRLLAAFVCTFGKVEGPLNVAQKADGFLTEEFEFPFAEEFEFPLADPGLSHFDLAARLADEIHGSLREQAVIAAILTIRGYLQGLETKEALKCLEQANEVQPNNALTLKLRGVTKLALGKLDGAQDDLDRADNLQPNDAITRQVRVATE